MIRGIALLGLLIALLAAAPAAQEAAPAAAPALPAELAGIEQFTFMGREVGYIPSDRFLQFLANAEAGVQQTGIFDGRGALAILLIVLVGGLALNLTPCVLPMIPINLAIIGAGTRSGSRVRGFLLGGAYGGAMALVYGAIGLIVILTAGTFGTLNSSPWFNVAIALLFVVLGLAMFDRFSIDFSRFSSRFGGEGKRGSFPLAFGMGAIAALLAGACVAPVVLQVVLFSSDLYARGTTIALALPFLLGLGMALPWPIAGAGLAALPKPGPWMAYVKHAFGVIILGMAVYYGSHAYSLFQSSQVTAAAQVTMKDGWYHSLPDALAVAQAEGKPVFIDMWATWCTACFVMEETTFRDDAVVAGLDNYVKVKFQAEDPEMEPAKTLMTRWDTVGLPTYVILRPQE
ncbi:MAG: protein-disulfide reductase DsbD family protein [Vicinamibacterales bacterium]